MKTGTRKKGTEGLLKGAIAICVGFTVLNLIGFVIAHIPPYSVGQCLQDPNPFLKVVVTENRILQGASVLHTNFLGDEHDGMISFIDLRNPQIKAVECSK